MFKEFYEQLNEANNIIKNIKMPNEPKRKEIYFPSEVMRNILSYLPTPLDHHKKKKKIVNEDFEIIKSTEFCRNGFPYGWNLYPISIPISRINSTYNLNKLKFWTKLIKEKRISLQLKEDLKVISPKLDRLINELKTKKNIINFLESKDILINRFKQEKKADMIESIKKNLKYYFTLPYPTYFYSDYLKTVRDFMYSL